MNYRNQKIWRTPTYDIWGHWRAVSTLLGLISSVQRNRHHWRSNQRRQIAVPKLYNRATSSYRMQVAPNQLVTVILFVVIQFTILIPLLKKEKNMCKRNFVLKQTSWEYLRWPVNCSVDSYFGYVFYEINIISQPPPQKKLYLPAVLSICLTWNCFDKVGRRFSSRV